MGGFFGVVSSEDAISDVFFATDYHSHLGTRRAGIAAYDKGIGLQREIHNIQNSPFRTKFEDVFDEMQGTSAIGCISDYDPQPLLIHRIDGVYAICVTGLINNSEQIVKDYLSKGGHLTSMSGGLVNSTEIVAALINQKPDFAEGIAFAQEVIDGTASILILRDDGTLIAARDKLGRIPVSIGKSDTGYCASFEAFAYKKLGYKEVRDLGPGEIVKLETDGMTVLKKPNKEMKICSFLWSYYGYPTSTYEGMNVEVMRYKNGQILSQNDKDSGFNAPVDYIVGVPDSGTPHAIGYANESGIPFARAFIKYTPTWARSFTPAHQSERKKVAKMKQIPVHELIEGKDLLFVDDSIVRGTQLRETVDFLYDNGAKSVHMRSACPPIMYGCKYLNFSRATSDLDLIARRIILELEGEDGFNFIEEYSDSSTERGKNLRKAICEKLHFASLEFQSLEGVIKAIGIDPENLCTYCWNGKE